MVIENYHFENFAKIGCKRNWLIILKEAFLLPLGKGTETQSRKHWVSFAFFQIVTTNLVIASKSSSLQLSILCTLAYLREESEVLNSKLLFKLVVAAYSTLVVHHGSLVVKTMFACTHTHHHYVAATKACKVVLAFKRRRTFAFAVK